MRVGDAKTAQEWQDRFADASFPPFGRHRKEDDRCHWCRGFWPCDPARDAEKERRRLDAR